MAAAIKRDSEAQVSGTGTPNAEAAAGAERTGTRELRRRGVLPKWVLIAGVVLAAFVGWSSPTRGTFFLLGGTLFLLCLLMALQRHAPNSRCLSARVHPGVFVLVTTVSLGLVCCELGLRFFLYQRFPDFKRMNQETLGYKHDPTLGWFPAPNSHKTITVGERVVSVTHNSKGFRDPEPSFDARPAIVFLGDSFVWGYNLEAPERFTERLRQKHPEWQIHNFGVVGYGTDQEYLLLQRHFAEYRPRLVFLVFCTENDYTDNSGSGDGTWAFKPRFRENEKGLQLHGVPVPRSDWVFCSQHPLLSKSCLVRLTMKAWANLHSARFPNFDRGITFALVRALGRYVADHGAVFCVGLTARDAELEKSLQEAKIPWVDLTTDLRAEGDFHWGPEGHTFAAERIDQFLATNKFLQTQGLK